MLINSCGCSFKAYFAESLSSATASKKKKSWVEAAIHVCAVESPEDGTSQDLPKMVEHRLQNYSENPFMWWDKRTDKSDPKGLDIRHAKTGGGLFTGEVIPIQSKLNSFQIANVVTDASSSNWQQSSGHLWQEESTDRSPLCDNRSNNSLDSLKVSQKSIVAADWIDDQRSSERVKLTPERKRLRMVGESTFQESNCSYSAGRVENTVQKRLLQLIEVQKIHAHLMETRNEIQLFEKNVLMSMYVKCGSMSDVRHVFDNMPKRNVVSWNVVIQGYVKQEDSAMALQMYSQMHSEGVQPSDRTLVTALKACSSLAPLEEEKHLDGKGLKGGFLEIGRAIHSQAMKTGVESNVFVGTVLVDMYAKCGNMDDARHVFDELLDRDVVSWNTMISGYADKDNGVHAFELYAQMHQAGVRPDHQTLVCMLKACSGLAAMEERIEKDGQIVEIGCLERGRAIHSQAVKDGFESDIFLGTTLVDMYSKCGNMEDARHTFEELLHRDVISWTAMISGYAQKEEGALALELYSRMYQEGTIPDDQTSVGALKACSSLAALEEGMQVNGNFLKTEALEKARAIHSQVVRHGFESDIFVRNTLVDVYAKCGDMEDAQHIFDGMPHRSVVPWTAIISGHAQNDRGAIALELFSQMHQEGVIPNHRTYVAALKACSSLVELEEGYQVDVKFIKIGCLEKGRAIHTQAMKSGFESDVYVRTTLVDMYAKCGSMNDAQHLFDEMPHGDVVSWTAIIWGYAQQEESEKAFKLYAQMQEQGLLGNNFTFASILKACGNIAALKTGKELHAQICRVGLEATAVVATALIDMYAKCGSMVDAQQLFDALHTRALVTWNALIAGYARQGQSNIVFHLFERMRQEGIQPNPVTFLSVLTVCSHAGLVDKGEKYFRVMSREYDIIPSIEHYTCMIDLLGRTGQVKGAVAMMENMPFQPNFVSWLAVLGACRKWKNVEAGRHAFEHVVRLDEKNAAAYALMSNIYAHAHMWENLDKIQV